MDVTGQGDLVALFAGGENHALYGAGGAAHHEERVGRAKGIRRQLFRLPDHRYQVAEIVQGLHAVYIHAHALPPRKAVSSRLPRPRLWPGTSKGTTHIC